ncbi:MAG TPA: malonyl-CoA decarboxylase family protein [Candidatus Acidoferrales bacterium]
MRLLCQHLLSQRGEISQQVLAQEIIKTYREMDSEQRLCFFEMLCREFSADEAAIRAAAASYERAPSHETLATLSAAVESPRRELFQRINTAPGGTETLVALRGHLLDLNSSDARFEALDEDLKHLFRSWFNCGFLRLERITLNTSPAILEKLIRYESVHKINGLPDLRRRLEQDRWCFAFFHPALPAEPIIFAEVAAAMGGGGDVESLLDVHGPVLAPEEADAAIFYSINNCLKGLRGIPFGNFLIRRVMAEIAAEFPNITTFGTLSPLPRFARALRDTQNEDGLTLSRLSRLLADYATPLSEASGRSDPVEGLFLLLKEPLAHRDVLAGPLRRLALAYLSRARQNGKLSDPVASFHFSNGARLERINVFGNLRSYGLEASFGVMAGYQYVASELEENRERFVRDGHARVAERLCLENEIVSAAWQGAPGNIDGGTQTTIPVMWSGETPKASD